MANKSLDLRGSRCPLTLLQMKQFLYNSTLQDRVTFIFDDPGAARDLPLYLHRENKWEVNMSESSGVFTAVCVEG
jgi:TusA-related sulfurtransferase